MTNAETGQRPEFLVPALIGGSLAGVLSGAPVLNCLCCLWVIGGAALSTSLLAKNQGGVLSTGDGAIAGALSGIVAAVVNSLVGIPLRTVNARIVQNLFDKFPQFLEDVPSGWDTWFDQALMPFSVPMFLFGLFISAAVFAAVGALGGVIGVSLFGRKKTAKPQGAPDAPQDPGHHQS
jgi:hypothetical protein